MYAEGTRRERIHSPCGDLIGIEVAGAATG